MATRSLCLAIWLLSAQAALPAHPDQAHLLFHVETADGRVLASQHADRLFNPASVVKIGTSLWSLQRLGAEHRYQTVVGIQGRWDRSSGMVNGSLVVLGGGDPDFHLENAFLVARELNRLGVRVVRDGLVLSGPFTFGWEHGVGKREGDPRLRLQTMGRRLQLALDPEQWDRETRQCWLELCDRRGWRPQPPPRVVIRGSISVVETVDPAHVTPLVRHLSNPLKTLLKRFNVYSNNDIIRIADGLGGVDGLQDYLRHRLSVQPSELQLETASGEERNRMTSRVVIRLLRALREDELGAEPADILPIPGCDPGPIPRMFERLAAGDTARTAVCKTGTLRDQDDGVAVLAGYLSTERYGEVLFSVAAPAAGERLGHWRKVEEDWLLGLIERLGGALPRPCSGSLPYSDTMSIVEEVPP
jgi:D-alanyl-D-alanine carboxypeptidase/D-alanyl-D-alanine-endopeptidase (penicillin-binding protein 4)